MARGTLRIYLGAAPGVGKTFAMLNEGWRRAQRGTDVIVAFVETHGRPNTAAQIRDLEVVPRRRLVHDGRVAQEMDLDAVLARQPTLALVDDLAHTNVPGSRHTTRWQDIRELLDAGINVLSTVNIQHLTSLNDVVLGITGLQEPDTVPDEVVRAADQIELVDMSPEALRRRMAHGNIYRAEHVDAALGNYFRVGNLAALRELALLWVADRVEEGLQDYRERHGIAEPWETKERVVVALTGSNQGARLIRRGARMAARTRAELVGVHVRPTDGLTQPEGTHLEDHQRLLAELGGRYAETSGTDVAAALVSFARAENATQLLLGATRQSRLAELFRGSVINEVVRLAGAIDVHIISASSTGEENGPQPLPRLPVKRRLARLPRRRLSTGWLLAVLGMPTATLVLTRFRGPLGESGSLLVLLLCVIAVGLVGGAYPALAGALVAFGFADWYLIPPLHSFTVGRGEDTTALVTFVVVAAVVSLLIDGLARRTVQVARAKSEAEALARLAGGAVLPVAGLWTANPTPMSEEDALQRLVGEVRAAFGLDAVAVLKPLDTGERRSWQIQAAAGMPVPSEPSGALIAAELGAGSVLVLTGTDLPADDRRMLAAFVAHLRIAQQQARLQEEAASAAELADANELRTALLAAVSHDLRTPLASIKASATSLLADDVQWSPEQVRAFCQTIDTEADRLNSLVDNLLDMSRLQTGALKLAMRPVGLEEVVYSAMSSLSNGSAGVRVDVAESLPEVLADPALLERAVANLVDNALAWSPSEIPVRVEAGRSGEHIDLRVIDQGPGIPEDQREAVFLPFQRLGDARAANSNGVGLGLAVAKGFVEAMSGQLTLDDTPGGGLTAVIRLTPVAAAAPGPPPLGSDDASGPIGLTSR